MIQHYFKLLFHKAFNKNIYFTVLNLLGLSLGLLVFILIILFIDYQRDYDTFHDNHSEIYRIVSENDNNYSLNANKNRSKHEWMQAYPDHWDKVLADLYGSKMVKSNENIEKRATGIVELNTRVNFKFNRE